MITEKFILVCLVCLMVSCEKDEPKPFCTNKILKGITWEIFGKETGLHDDFIKCLACDDVGNIWVGTNSNGISRFNETGWKKFCTSNSGLPNDSILDIKFDRMGVMWIGTKNGLAKFDGDLWVVFKDEDLPGRSNLVRRISIDINNVKWIAYGHFDEGGLIKLNQSKWTLFTPENSSLPGRIIDEIYVDNNNRIWLGTHQGLVRISNGNWTIFSKDNSNMPYNQIWDISGDYQGNIWVGSNAFFWLEENYLHGTLLRYDGINWHEHKPSETGKSSNRVNAITTDNFGNIWVATASEQNFNYNILMFNGQEWFVLSDLDQFFPNPFTIDMVVDNNNILWVGAAGLGLIKIDMIFE